MNSRERMATAMARQKPDRVPVMCQLAFGHYALRSGLDAVELWHDGEAFAEGLVTMQRRYGFDGVLVNMPGRDPDWRKKVERVEASEDGQRVHWRGGRFTVCPPDDSPHAYVAEDEPFVPAFDEVDPERLFYVEPHDLAGIKWPWSWGPDGDVAEPGSRAFFPPWQGDTLRATRRRAGPDVSVHAEVFSPFSQLLELLDHQEALAALILDEAKVLACLERLAEGALCLAGIYAETDCDALLVSSAFVGAGFLSRDHYAKFELPFLHRIVDGLKAEHPELPVYVHTCGAIGDRLDLMEATGVDGIDTFDPPPIGTVDLADAVARLGGRVFIKGNLDPVHTLLEGDVDAVRAAARERLQVAGPGGAYILSSACSVPPGAPPENLMVLREEAEVFDA